MERKDYAAPMLIIGCVLFGLGSIIVKFVPVGGFAIAFWRMLVATVVFAFLFKLKRQRFPRSRKAILFAVLGGVFLSFDFAFWHESIYAVGPGISTLLNSLQIFFLAAIGYFFFQERQSKMQMLSLGLAIIGVVLITGKELGHNIEGVYGIIMGLLSALMLAGSMVMVKQVQRTEPTPLFALMVILNISGTLALIIPSLIFDFDKLYPQTAADWGWILVYGTLIQCVAWGAIAFAIPLLSLSITGLLLLTEPVIALVIDYFLLDKPIDATQWSGALLTLVAIYLGSVKSKKA